MAKIRTQRSIESRLPEYGPFQIRSTKLGFA